MKKVYGDQLLACDGTLRDDAAAFLADKQISSPRTFLVASIIECQKGRRNLVTTGFNRNVFQF